MIARRHNEPARRQRVQSMTRLPICSYSGWQRQGRVLMAFQDFSESMTFKPRREAGRFVSELVWDTDDTDGRQQRGDQMWWALPLQDRHDLGKP